MLGHDELVFPKVLRLGLAVWGTSPISLRTEKIADILVRIRDLMGV